VLHSRFIFSDRQSKEECVLNLFGPSPQPQNARDQGHLLIATQVVEQSLDLDFDWLITQICPVDLLFQRMGRLHRHAKNQAKRSSVFTLPICTVFLPIGDDYALHELIYGNSRVLWRTQQLLESAQKQKESNVIFPAAYRDWIEQVYLKDNWGNEPNAVLESDAKFMIESESSRYNALTNLRRNPGLDDNDSNIAVLTRDGDMNLNLLLIYMDSQGRQCFLNGTCLDELDDSEKAEVFNLNSVPVPLSWGKCNQLPMIDQENVCRLIMKRDENDRFFVQHGHNLYFYHSNTGLERKKLICVGAEA